MFENLRIFICLNKLDVLIAQILLYVIISIVFLIDDHVLNELNGLIARSFKIQT